MTKIEDFATKHDLPKTQILAYGYTIERDTLEIWISPDGLLIRTEYKQSTDNREDSIQNVRVSDKFEADFFHDNIKRFYRDTVNLNLIGFFEDAGRPLSMTDRLNKLPPGEALYPLWSLHEITDTLDNERIRLEKESKRIEGMLTLLGKHRS